MANSLYVQLSQVTLMLDAQGGGKMILITQRGKKLNLSHHQLDISKLLINLHVINKSMSCIDLIFCTNQNIISNYGVDLSLLISVIIISFMVKLTFVSPSHRYMSVKSEIIVKQMLKMLKKQ